jgi:TRAP-type C4-dicarboxylate transport system substrate-binding protein
MNQRADLAVLNASLRPKLEAKGFTFNEPDSAPFEARLREAGFYAEWTRTYGDEAWAILESAVGRTLA